MIWVGENELHNSNPILHEKGNWQGFLTIYTYGLISCLSGNIEFFFFGELFKSGMSSCIALNAGLARYPVKGKYICKSLNDVRI